MDAAPVIDSYAWAGGREAMLRFGPADGRAVVMALPLFEEANRTRAFGVAILRALAARGIGGVLLDLPGQGESARATESVTLLDLQSAFAAAVEQGGLAGSGFGVAIRSGALLDPLGLLAGRWHLAPQDGTELLRELRRLHELAAEKRSGSDRWYLDGNLPADAPDPPVLIGGNPIGVDLLTGLTVETPYDGPAVPRRIVRPASDPRPADRHIDAVPLWRRSEPGQDLALARLLAADIAAWIASCAG